MKKVRGIIALVIILSMIVMLPTNVGSISKAAENELEGTIQAQKCDTFSDYMEDMNIGKVTPLCVSIDEPCQEKENDRVHVISFTLPEEGYTMMCFNEKNNTEYNDTIDYAVYSDINRTNQVLDGFCYDWEKNCKEFKVLKAGTYYVELKPDRCLSDQTIDVDMFISVAYRSCKNKFVTVKPSTTKMTNKDVTISVSHDKDVESIWYEEGCTGTYLLGNEYHWTENKKLNEGSFKVSKNSTYTLQYKDVFGNYYYETVVIKNIDKVKPAKPVLTYYKAGKTYIWAKAEKKSLVYVKIGKKYYKRYASSRGYVKITTPKLKKGYLIYVCTVDAAKNKSGWKGYRIK